MQKTNAFVDQRFGGRQLQLLLVVNSPGVPPLDACDFRPRKRGLIHYWHECPWTLSASPFAEEDSSLTAEDKAIARFQKQRMKELKGARPEVPPQEASALASVHHARVQVLASASAPRHVALLLMTAQTRTRRIGALLRGKTGCRCYGNGKQCRSANDCQMAAGDKFALLDEDEEQLTHMGRSLADDDFKAVRLRPKQRPHLKCAGKFVDPMADS